MRGLRMCAAAAAVVVVGAAVGVHGASPAAPGCAPRTVSSAYGARIQRAVGSRADLWGGELLRAPGGPTYAGARRYLTPLTHGMQWGGRPLVPTGSYYLALSFPFTTHGSPVYALHAADGSAIVTRHIGGPSLSVFVGNGSEAYGSCPARLPAARLAEGWLPILQTQYTDAHGVRYRQESFVGRVYGMFGARSVISFVRLTVDTRGTRYGATVRLVPWKRLAHTAPDRFALGGQTRLIVSDGAQFVDGVARYRVRAHEQQEIYALWLNAPSDARYIVANASTYDTSRSAVVQFWQRRLDNGATFDVPEPTVENAMRGVLTQVIANGWRYSIGNPYEELSYAESLDTAEVAAEYGYFDVARSILDFSLQRMRIRPWRFTAFRGAHILVTAAEYYRLSHDHAFLKAATPELDQLVRRIASRRVTDGPARGRLLPEALSTDLENKVADSVSGQIEAVTGLGAIARVWGSTGYAPQAQRARDVAAGLDAALTPAVDKARVRLHDGSLFVPADLSHKATAYDQLTHTRDGSYWNLVMPYAFASGWFRPHTAASRGILRYLLAHGSRLLGVPRTYARTVYGKNVPGAGLAPVYALNMSRFLADNDQPDQLDLTLYGLLAAGMTENTFVSGEAVSVLPVRGAYERTMFMPPNAGANASYLGTLRLLLVHERRTARGAPDGLDLCFATPPAWLANGQRIDVEKLPTSFGRVTIDLQRSGSRITGSLFVPANARARLRLRVSDGEVSRILVAGHAYTGDAIDLGTAHGTLTVAATISPRHR